MFRHTGPVNNRAHEMCIRDSCCRASCSLISSKFVSYTFGASFSNFAARARISDTFSSCFSVVSTSYGLPHAMSECVRANQFFSVRLLRAISTARCDASQMCIRDRIHAAGAFIGFKTPDAAVSVVSTALFLRAVCDHVFTLRDAVSDQFGRFKVIALAAGELIEDVQCAARRVDVYKRQHTPCRSCRLRL